MGTTLLQSTCTGEGGAPRGDVLLLLLRGAHDTVCSEDVSVIVTFTLLIAPLHLDLSLLHAST
jgi:hypothetical protein